MRGKKLTGMVVAFIVGAVVLCSCGVASEPESTAVPQLPVEQDKAVYVEQAVPYDVSENVQVEGY